MSQLSERFVSAVELAAAAAAGMVQAYQQRTAVLAELGAELVAARGELEHVVGAVERAAVALEGIEARL